MRIRKSSRPRFVLRVEPLERRDAPATLIGNNKITYQDADGDNVTVTFSKPILNTANVNDVFTFDTETVDGSNATKQQLRAVDLTVVGATANGTTITLSTLRSPVTGGDGFAAVGLIDATSIDLSAVTIDGDLGCILAGDTTLTTSGLKGLTVQSLGRFGISTGAPGLAVLVQGGLGFLRVKTDVRETMIVVQGGADGRIGPINIGGSLVGTGLLAGRIVSFGAMGMVRIGGNVQGGEDQSGQIFSWGTLAGVTIGGSLIGGVPSFPPTGGSSGKITSIGAMGAVRIGGNVQGGAADSSGVISGGALAGVTIGGSLIGGAGSGSAVISSGSAMGAVRITGNVQGGSGTGSGLIGSGGTLAGVTIGGSFVGGDGSESGKIGSSGAMGPVRIAGNFQGGGGDRSGEINGNTTVVGVTIGGSLIGGPRDLSGLIGSLGAMGPVRIGGDLIGGSASGSANLELSGYIQAKRIANLTLGGSLIAGTKNTTGTFANNGAIRVDDDIGTILIKGNIIGNATNPAIISARGSVAPAGTNDLAISRLCVLGRVEYAQILAGVDVNGAAKNADAQIGNILVGGDWIASSIAAGAVAGPNGFGDGDTKMAGAGVKDEATVISRIARVTIGGQALGTVGGSDHFGIVAENVVVLRIGGTMIPLVGGNDNDDFFVGISGDFKMNEI